MQLGEFLRTLKAADLSPPLGFPLSRQAWRTFSCKVLSKMRCLAEQLGVSNKEWENGNSRVERWRGSMGLIWHCHIGTKDSVEVLEVLLWNSLLTERLSICSSWTCACRIVVPASNPWLWKENSAKIGWWNCWIQDSTYLLICRRKSWPLSW